MPTKAASSARSTGTAICAKAYDCTRDLLADKSIDAVLIADARPLAQAASCSMPSRAGKDVYREKPMTLPASKAWRSTKRPKAKKGSCRSAARASARISAARPEQIVQSASSARSTLIRAVVQPEQRIGRLDLSDPAGRSPRDRSTGRCSWVRRRSGLFSLERFFRWRCYRDYSGGIATDLFCPPVHHRPFPDERQSSRARDGDGRVIPLEGRIATCLTRSTRFWNIRRDSPSTLVRPSTTSSPRKAVSKILGTEGSLTIGGGGLMLHPDNSVEDNRWIVDSWGEGPGGWVRSRSQGDRE